MAISPTYCTHAELKRVFPQLDEFDGKSPLFSFTETDSGQSQAVDSYIHPNSGLITSLYRDGNDLDSGKQTIGTTALTAINNGGGYSAVATSFTVDSHANLADETYVKIGDEILYVTNVTTNSFAAVRGRLGTSAAIIADDAEIFQHFNPSADGQWLYDSDNDFVIMSATSNPSDNLMETGEDFSTMVTQYRGDASRLLDSFLDPNLPKNQLKNKAGDYDYLIIRSAALICASLMIKTNDPASEMANAYMEEAMGYVDKLNNGEAALSYQNTADSSKGIIRDVSYTDGSVRPVDTRGHYSGTFDLIRITIGTGGAMDGTATYNVWVKDADKLGIHQGNQVVTNEKINGDYQALAGGLQIRFAGNTKTSVATATNEWEVEVMGWSEEVDSSTLKPIRMTRKWQ